MDTITYALKNDFPPCHRSFAITFAWLCSSLLAAAPFYQHKNAYADIGATHDVLVSEFPSFNTPGIVDGRVEAIAIDGDTVYVGGNFTQIHNPLDEDGIINQPYLFAYSKSSGDIIESFDPQLNNRVYALETTGDAAGGVFAGGIFSNFNGESSRGRLAKIDINGDRVSGFSARPNASVTTMVRLNDTLYIGGNFDSITSIPIDKLAAINTTTGAVSPNLNLDFGGLLVTSETGADKAIQGIDDIDVTSDGQLMVVVGNFETIDGISRPRLAVIELEGQAMVSTWNTNVYDVQCQVLRLPQYIRGIDIAPDNSYFLVGTQGLRYLNEAHPACDTIARFDFNDLSDTDAQPTWVNYTGGDSVYEVVSTEHAVYVGGHFRWLNNSAGRDNAEPGSVERRGLAALDPLNGLTYLNWRADRNPRGVGVFALIAEEEGLYLGDDTDFLNGSEHLKLKFLPLSADMISRPEVPFLPTSIITPNGDNLDGINFDGINFAAQTTLNNFSWSDARGGVFVGGRLFHADSQSRIWTSVFADGAFQDRTQVELFGLTEDQWDINQIGGMFFDYEQGRLYYTIRNDAQLFWRAFTPASPYFGEDGFIAEVQGDIAWGDVRGMDVVDGYLYFARTDSRLYRSQINGADVVNGTIVPVSGPDIDGRDWDNDKDLLAFLSDGIFTSESEAELEFEFSGSDSVNRFKRFEFPVTPGVPVVVRLEWLDPDAIVELRVLDANGVRVVSDITRLGSPKWLIAPAGDGGMYSASVLIREGSTSYTLQVNPNEEPPPPLADFVFTSVGDDVNGRWQVFKFDVEVGELVEAQIIWDDPTADVDVFLRDEATKTKLDGQTDGSASPAMLSAIANISEEWSVAVRINSGSTSYDVYVDTTATDP